MTVRRWELVSPPRTPAGTNRDAEPEQRGPAPGPIQSSEVGTEQSEFLPATTVMRLADGAANPQQLSLEPES